MSLSQEPVFPLLKNDFVVGVRDISGEPWAGSSGWHDVNGAAIATTNGAGPHNIQMFILAPDGTVIHCLPGYWSAKDLASELEFAKQLFNLYQDPQMSLAEKRLMAGKMQLQHLKRHSLATQLRSRMQPFDAQFELQRRDNKGTVRRPPLLGTVLAFTGLGQLTSVAKSTDEIMHERMAKQSFVPYDRFDVIGFCDYGTQFYDRRENRVTARLLGKLESSIRRHPEATPVQEKPAPEQPAPEKTAPEKLAPDAVRTPSDADAPIATFEVFSIRIPPLHLVSSP